MKNNRTLQKEKHSKQSYCLKDGCRHKRASTADMGQCSHCAIWHHLDCVGLHQSNNIGVWPCPRCRVQTDLLHQCHRMLQEISSELVALTLLQDNVHKDMGSLARTKNLEKSNQDLVKLLGNKTAQCDVLAVENSELKRHVAQLQEIATAAWSPPKNLPSLLQVL